jgi:hypothetical protein
MHALNKPETGAADSDWKMRLRLKQDSVVDHLFRVFVHGQRVRTDRPAPDSAQGVWHSIEHIAVLLPSAFLGLQIVGACPIAVDLRARIKLWLGRSLAEGSLGSYVAALVLDGAFMQRTYEEWSFLRHDILSSTLEMLLHGLTSLSIPLDMCDPPIYSVARRASGEASAKGSAAAEKDKKKKKKGKKKAAAEIGDRWSQADENISVRQGPSPRAASPRCIAARTSLRQPIAPTCALTRAACGLACADASRQRRRQAPKAEETLIAIIGTVTEAKSREQTPQASPGQSPFAPQAGSFEPEHNPRQEAAAAAEAAVAPAALPTALEAAPPPSNPEPQHSAAAAGTRVLACLTLSPPHAPTPTPTARISVAALRAAVRRACFRRQHTAHDSAHAPMPHGV